MSSCVRRVCRHAMRRYENKAGKHLGGETEFVVIDESNFRHKRKDKQLMLCCSQQLPEHFSCYQGDDQTML
ncbi:uncharacterized protein DAT39_005450 [Clarias magur]|uniref:Uncharacterized protein n=1 Tax=Clarias magur TaxID=1594786 RepID=A0A8J4UR49_CLAMG|nr:uncharacterized protein DAT39_005450 [Clarias magur]